MVRGASSFPPFNPELLKQLVHGSPRNLFVREYALVKTVFCASYLVRRRKEVLAIFQLFLRRLLHKEVNVLIGPDHERRLMALP